MLEIYTELARDDFLSFFYSVCVQVKFSMLEIYNEVARDEFLSFFYSVCVLR